MLNHVHRFKIQCRKDNPLSHLICLFFKTDVLGVKLM